MIEMIQGHAGVLLPGDSYRGTFRWTLTDRGRRAILRDPPLEIAEWDAEDDLRRYDIGDPTLAFHRRISINLNKRAERLHQKMAWLAKREDGR
jgi:hypothetical protein